MNTLLLGDCLELMATITSNSVDMILCDLPYGTTQNKWDSIIPLEPLWKEYFRISDGPIILTAAQPFSSLLVTSQIRAFRYEWIWVKSAITGVLNAKIMPVRKHEQILVFSNTKNTYRPQGLVRKGTITRQGGNSSNYGHRSKSPYIQEWTNYPRDVLDFPSERGCHPTQKPVALMEYLVKTYSREGNVVMDNCMGSGTTGVACVNTGRNFIGIEKDEKYFQIAQDRINKAVDGKMAQA